MLSSRAVSRAFAGALLAAGALASVGDRATAQSIAWSNLGFGSPGCCGVPAATGTTPRYGRPLSLRVRNAPPGAFAWFVLGTSRIDFPLLGGTLVPSPLGAALQVQADAAGEATLRLRIPDLCPQPTFDLYAQALIADPIATAGFSFSNAIRATFAPDVDSDFNGDGFADLAIGVPNESVDGFADAGAVNVIYGTAAGLVNGSTQLIRQGGDLSGPIADSPAEDEGFGSAIAVGDFDADGYDDLVIGVPREDQLTTRQEAGQFHVVYGSASGLQGGNFGREDRVFYQGRGGLRGVTAAFDWFGKSLTAGDFDGDGYDDVAVGAPYDGGPSGINEGVVQVLWGSANGLSTADNLTIDAGFGGQADGRFGWNVGTGDFDGDGIDELVVARPYDDVSGQQDAGSVDIVRFDGRVELGRTEINKNRTVAGFPIQGSSRQFDLLGFSIAAGDFDDDGYDDLGIGIPYEDINGQSAAGGVLIVRGSVNGVTGQGNQLWNQDSPGFLGVAALSARFGYSLAAGDFDDDDDVTDLAIGVPGDRFGGVDVGAVQILFGRSGVGLSGAGDVLLTQNSLGLGAGAADDEFSWCLFAGRFDDDCADDLAIGVPGATVNNRDDAGGVAIRYASPATPAQWWDQGPMRGTPETGDRVGGALAGSPDQRPL